MKKVNKRINKKKVIIFILIFLIIISGVSYFFISNYIETSRKEKLEEERKQKEILRVKTLKENYSEYVITVKEAVLYEKDNNKYKEAGKVSENMVIHLDEINTDEYKEEYIKLKNIDYYINYKDIAKNEYKEDIWSKRYKRYLPFNQNVVLKENYELYENEDIKYTLNKEISLPIIINETDKYYVEYDDKLLYVMKSDNIATVDSSNTTEEETSHFAIINYHFIIDPAVDHDCTSTLCMSKSEFESHMKLLSDEGYFTVNTKELDWFIDKKIRLSKKTVMITEDDGWYAYSTSSILEKYNLNATLFIITSSYNKKSDFETPYLEVHSHGHDLHVNGECPGGRGARITCIDHDWIVNDLKTSSQILGGSTIFCYPFYEYNDHAINALKDAGYTMAFAGGGRDVYQGVNKYIIPRYGISAGNSLNSLRGIITVN